MQLETRRLAAAVFINRLLLRYTKVWNIDKGLVHLEAGPSVADLWDMDLSVKMVILTFIPTLFRFGIIPKY